MPKRLRRLFSLPAIPSWALIIWRVFDGWDTMTFAIEQLDPLWKFLASPLGDFVTLAVGFVVLAILVMRPEKKQGAEISKQPITIPNSTLRETEIKEYPLKVIEAVDLLIKHGDFLCSQMQDKDFSRTELITPTQEWLDEVNRQVWDNVPNHASYITGEQGGLTGDERIRYQGWANESAMLRISVDRRLSRLRRVRSQIQGSHSEDSQTK